MSTKQTPREGCDWTDARCVQLRKLETLLNTAYLLNHRTNMLGNIKEVISLANDLREWGQFDTSEEQVSFINFLRDQAIQDRFHGERKGGKS